MMKSYPVKPMDMLVKSRQKTDGIVRPRRSLDIHAREGLHSRHCRTERVPSKLFNGTT